MIIEKDFELGDISVRPVGGAVSGYVTYIQPEGCVDYRTASDNIGRRRIIGKVAIISGDVALIQSDSDAFDGRAYRYGGNFFVGVA